MYSTEITVRGNVVDDPRVHTTEAGHTVVNFRLASTERRRASDADQWVDGNRLFLSVSCWRVLGENVAGSLRKGQPVIVHGKLYCREYERDGQNRLEYKLDADAVGHDLSRGRTVFSKSSGTASISPSVELDDDGLPPMAEEPDWLTGTQEAPEPALVGS